jgi:hypothetical protein
MNTKSIIIRGLTVLCLLSSVFCFTGCSTAGAAKFAEFEKLGITEAEIAGKFSHTEYTVTEKDGVRRAELNHTNAWLPKVRLVRTTKAN